MKKPTRIVALDLRYSHPGERSHTTDKMLWNDDSIGTGAVLYMLDHGYLPEVLSDDIICQSYPDRVKEADARFLLRYMRRENY